MRGSRSRNRAARRRGCTPLPPAGVSRDRETSGEPESIGVPVAGQLVGGGRFLDSHRFPFVGKHALVSGCWRLVTQGRTIPGPETDATSTELGRYRRDRELGALAMAGLSRRDLN